MLNVIEINWKVFEGMEFRTTRNGWVGWLQLNTQGSCHKLNSWVGFIVYTPNEQYIAHLKAWYKCTYHWFTRFSFIQRIQNKCITSHMQGLCLFLCVEGCYIDVPSSENWKSPCKCEMIGLTLLNIFVILQFAFIALSL